MLRFCSCSCSGNEKAQARHAGEIELSARENVWENKTTSIKGKTLLHNPVAAEQTSMLRRSETQFGEEEVVSGEGNSPRPHPRRLWKDSPAAVLGTWRGMATAESRECTDPRLHLGTVPQQPKELPLSYCFLKPQSSASALHTL